jgi:hypothetical protein
MASLLRRLLVVPSALFLFAACGGDDDSTDGIVFPDAGVVPDAAPPPCPLQAPIAGFGIVPQEGQDDPTVEYAPCVGNAEANCYSSPGGNFFWSFQTPDGNLGLKIILRADAGVFAESGIVPGTYELADDGPTAVTSAGIRVLLVNDLQAEDSVLFFGTSGTVELIAAGTPDGDPESKPPGNRLIANFTDLTLSEVAGEGLPVVEGGCEALVGGIELDALAEDPPPPA